MASFMACLVSVVVVAVAGIPTQLDVRRGQADEECAKHLGMESRAITDGQSSASSSYSNNHASIYGRLNSEEGAGAWSAGRGDAYPWLQIDLRSEMKVTRVATQGRGHSYNQYVTKYRLQYSNDGENFMYYREQGQTTDKEFAGNSDMNTVVSHELNPPIMARYICFRPTAYRGWISMRVELYSCQELSTTTKPPTTKPGVSEAFASLDFNKDGFLSEDDLEKFGILWSQVADFDLNSDRKLSPEEFGILEAVVINRDETNYLNHFRAADMNHDGYITAEELQQRYKNLGHDFTLSHFTNLIEQKDKNSDGKFEYKEFQEFMQN